MLMTMGLLLVTAAPNTHTATTAELRPGAPRLFDDGTQLPGGAPPTGPAATPRLQVSADTPKALGRKYGWQILVVDGVSHLIGLAVFAADDEGPALAIAGSSLAVSAFGSAAVHFAHGKYGRGVGAFFMRGGRAGAMTLGAYLGIRGCDGEGLCEVFGGLLGGAIGFAITTIPIILLDYVWARDAPEPEATAGLQWAPTFATDGDRTTFGLGARF